MLISQRWLSRYVDLSMPLSELEDRLSFSGLNHEGTETVGDDQVLDLEVTSNRGDCLGHLGVAREVGVLYDLPVRFPQPSLNEGPASAESLLNVDNQFIDACPRYTARLIRGVRIGSSPDWLADSLRSVGISVVNNIVDITNYVMLECGQPLHAFDLAKLRGGKIIVRPAKDGESIEAIDHRTYALDPSMCVIADCDDAIAVAGVMGGASSEVTGETTDLVLEAAVFTPLSVRRTARALKLHSPSSFRFERRVDPVGVEWASRRACEMICDLAGGTVTGGMLDTAPEIPRRDPIRLRGEQIRRILGIDVDFERTKRILTGLGCEASSDDHQFIPPSWRHDLTREIDLIEEIARIHGYDQIPEDAPIPVVPSRRRDFDLAVDRVRRVLTGAGLSEAMTPSVVTEKLDESLSPWTQRDALETQTAMLEGSRRLRRSLIPSLLQSRASNWAAGSVEAELFEIAHVYLRGTGDDTLPAETYSLGLVTGGDYFETKGVLETLVDRLGVLGRLIVKPTAVDGFRKGTSVELIIVDDGQNHQTTIGHFGTVDEPTAKLWKLPGEVHAAELALPALFSLANLVPQQQPISPYPSVHRDLNLIVDEAIRWGELETVVRQSVPDSLADVRYLETYRDPSKDGDHTKRILFSVELQSPRETLSGDQADQLIDQVVTACGKKFDARLLG